MKHSDQRTLFDRRNFLFLAARLVGLTTFTLFMEACSRIGLTPTPNSPTKSVPTPDTLSQSRESSTSPTVTNVPTQPATPSPTSGMTAHPEPTEIIDPTSIGLAKQETTYVAFVKTTDRADGVRRAINLLGINPIEGKSVFLKPNFNSADPPPASTSLDVLQSLVGELKRMGARTITIGDRSGMGQTRDVMERVGLYDLAGKLGVEVIDFDSLTNPGDWERVRPPDSHWEEGFLVASSCVAAQAIVQTCCLKTHRYGGHFTMSLKNSVGLVAKFDPSSGYNYMSELHNSSHQRRMIAEINTAYTPALIVLDGVAAFTSGGPASGKVVFPEVVLAGTDRIAVDAIGVAILRSFGTTSEVSQGLIFEQEQIARAVELGLGVDSPQKIEMITDDPASAEFAKAIQEILFAG